MSPLPMAVPSERVSVCATLPEGVRLTVIVEAPVAALAGRNQIV